MKTYIHKKLGWKAVQHTTPEYYKVYKSKTEDCYTLRSSLEIEDSEDWKKQLSDDILRLKLKEAEERGFVNTPAETEEIETTPEQEALADLENRVDDLSKRLEISLKFESDLLALVERYKDKIEKT